MNAIYKYEQYFTKKEFKQYWTKKNFQLFYQWLKLKPGDLQIHFFKKGKNHLLNILDLYNDNYNLNYKKLILDISIYIKPLNLRYSLTQKNHLILNLLFRSWYFNLFNGFKEFFVNSLFNSNLNLDSAYINSNLVFYLRKNENSLNSDFLYHFFQTQWNNFKRNEFQEFSLQANKIKTMHLFDLVILKVDRVLLPEFLTKIYYYQPKSLHNLTKLKTFLTFLKANYLPKNTKVNLNSATSLPEYKYVFVLLPKIFNIYHYLNTKRQFLKPYLQKIVSLQTVPNYNLNLRTNFLHFLTFKIVHKPNNNFLRPGIISLHYQKQKLANSYLNTNLFYQQVGQYLRNCLNQSLDFSFQTNHIDKQQYRPLISNYFQNVTSNQELLNQCQFLTNDHQKQFNFSTNSAKIIKNLSQFRVIHFNLRLKPQFQDVKHLWNWNGLINFNV